MVGNVYAGKSSLIGTLVSDTLDDGRGAARSRIMKHQHKLDSGRTSTSVTQLLGLDESCNTVVPTSIANNACADVVLRSQRLISLMGLASNEEYLRTTFAGVSRGTADFA